MGGEREVIGIGKGILLQDPDNVSLARVDACGATL
jgi:hypothetical protein